VGAADLPRRPPADTFLHGAIVPANTYQYTKFQLSSSISFRDKEGSQNLMWGLLAPAVPRTLKLCVWSKYLARSIKQRAKLEHRISMHHAIMRICICRRLTMYPKWFFGGFEDEDVKILCSNPQKALPCVNTRLSMCRV